MRLVDKFHQEKHLWMNLLGILWDYTTKIFFIPNHEVVLWEPCETLPMISTVIPSVISSVIKYKLKSHDVSYIINKHSYLLSSSLKRAYFLNTFMRCFNWYDVPVGRAIWLHEFMKFKYQSSIIWIWNWFDLLYDCWKFGGHYLL